MAIPVSWVDDGPNEEFPDPPNESWVPEDESNYSQAVLEMGAAVADLKRKGQELGDRWRGFSLESSLALQVIKPNPLAVITSVY